MSSIKYTFMFIASTLVFQAMNSTASAQLFGQSASGKIAEKKSEIPTCTHKIGVLAVHEPRNPWWDGLGLESPEALLKVIVRKSQCFTLVDRGAGFDVTQKERELAAGGQLQHGANIGAGQIKAADYVLVPDITSKNSDASGTNIGGILGGLVGGIAGQVMSGINIKSSSADVVLTVTNVRTSEQEAMEEGHGSKSDLSLGLGLTGTGLTAFGAGGISNYQNTEIGQVVALAYIEAYTKLVGDMGGLSLTAKTDAPSQAVTLTRPSALRATSNPKSKVIKQLNSGIILYPTGQKDVVWWEVSDDLGNTGWVSSLTLALAK